jgi:hypothetical protein
MQETYFQGDLRDTVREWGRETEEKNTKDYVTKSVTTVDNRAQTTWESFEKSEVKEMTCKIHFTNHCPLLIENLLLDF